MIGKLIHIYNKMSDILSILNQFNNTPEKNKIESVEKISVDPISVEPSE
jgi:hypothetical protein